MPPRHHHHHHHGHHHGPGFGPPLGALLVGGMVGGAVAAATRPPPPARYHRGHRYRQVIVVHQVPQGMRPLGPNEILVSVACPIGGRPGDPLELEVEGRAYSITIPQVREGESFYVRVPKQPIAAVPIATATQQQQQQQQQQQVPPVPPVYQATRASDQQAASQVPTANAVSNSNAVEAQVMPTPVNTEGSFAPVNPFMDDDDSGDDWVVAPNKAEFDTFFTAAGPTQKNGKVVLSPAQVRTALLPTGLAKEILRNVWELSDIDKV
jgi:hypothetical protein